ncbi:hypothetical protein [Pseudoalteromonas sp. CO325X]|nr:hypothetical protein [Pseudoalteromonas sp. CO325X]
MAQRNEQEYKKLNKLKESNRIKRNNLEELIALRKQMEMLANPAKKY